MEQKYLLLTAIIAVAAISGIILMELPLAVIAIVFVLVALLLIYIFKDHYTGSGIETEGEAILAAALIALAGMMISPWIVWAAIIGVLLITRQSIARIEKRLDAMEKQ